MNPFIFRKIAPAAAALLLALSACSTFDAGMEAWEGHSISELVRSWGEPDSIMSLGSGVEAYTWVMDDEDCQQTFTVRDAKIIGASDTNCDG